MAREMKSVHNWGDVAPALLISRSQNSSKFTKSLKLETIMEEEPQGSKLLYKSTLVSFPLLFSGLLYIFLCRGMY
ncbi:hypothetical protein Fmac_004691 [Flemingia macrophylla]|uniref:Uncharacterized protein n=1 Tax=Flemingia macrophylla TaxID=520843 RepID=A0ABD1N5L9_9FABA